VGPSRRSPLLEDSIVRILLRRSLLCLLTLALAACGDDGTGPDEDELTEEEFEALLEVMVALSDIGLEAVDGAPPAAAPAAVPQSFEIDPVTVPCPQGGSVLLEGDAIVDNDVEQLDMTLSLTHQACRATSQSSGLQFTIDGDPDIDYEFFIDFDDDDFDMEIDQEGAIEWSTGGRSGTCAMDIHIEFVGNITTQEFSGFVSGTVCGRDASGSLSG